MGKSSTILLTILAFGHTLHAQDSIVAVHSVVIIDSLQIAVADSISPLSPDTSLIVLDSIPAAPKDNHLVEIASGIEYIPGAAVTGYAWLPAPGSFPECGHGCWFIPPPPFCALSYVDHPWKQKNDSVITKIEKADANNLSANKPSEKPEPPSPPVIPEPTWMQAVLPSSPRMKRG